MVLLCAGPPGTSLAGDGDRAGACVGGEIFQKLPKRGQSSTSGTTARLRQGPRKRSAAGTGDQGATVPPFHYARFHVNPEQDGPNLRGNGSFHALSIFQHGSDIYNGYPTALQRPSLSVPSRRLSVRRWQGCGAPVKLQYRPRWVRWWAGGRIQGPPGSMLAPRSLGTISVLAPTW
jgi:hypothetical protein